VLTSCRAQSEGQVWTPIESETVRDSHRLSRAVGETSENVKRQRDSEERLLSVACSEAQVRPLMDGRLGKGHSLSVDRGGRNKSGHQ
jgi:hypothetical protein